MFQSPSLRGSGRFFPQPAQRQRRQSSFNPLHCGAVVASLLGRGDVAAGAPSFNPLHCGAVVASCPACRRRAGFRRVSIPFIAGQWSLHPALSGVKLALAWEFQSPSLRGSGRFQRRRERPGPAGREFQSPSLRGSGRFSPWTRSPTRTTSFNPLHCGAVVASRSIVSSGIGRRRVSIPFIAGQWSLLSNLKPWLSGTGLCFNPLHCGAVVASGGARKGGTQHEQVSIPFIAGQWSLHPT